MSSVADIAKKLNRAYKNDGLAITADVIPYYNRLPCNDLGADFPLYGGLPYGRIITISGKEHSGKAQPLDSPILTDSGYVKMGDIKVGDKVFGRDGFLHTVTGVYPQGIKPVYRIIFNDNTSTMCSDEHLWNVNKLQSGSWPKNKDGSIKWKTVELKDLLDQPLQGPSNEYIYHIPKCDSIQFSEKHIEIDPYLLGCLIGDGTLGDTGIGFSNIDKDILNEMDIILNRDYNMHLTNMELDGCEHRIVSNSKQEGIYNGYNYLISYKNNKYYGIKSAYEAVSETYDISIDKFSNIVRGTPSKVVKNQYKDLIAELIIELNPSKVAPNKGSKLRYQLDNYGLRCTSHNKHIPKDYLYNSENIRLSILQGLIDTDGYITSNGNVSFSSTSKQLAEDIAFLVRSFGGFVRTYSGISCYTDANGNKINTGASYNVAVNGLPKSLKLCRCQRKLNRWFTDNTKQIRYHMRAIKSIEYVGDKECQCIMIDSDEHLYLTDDLIVTHNTTGACAFLGAYQRANPDRTCVFVDVEHSLDKEFQSAMNGIDLTKLIYVNPEGMSGEQIMDAILEFQDSDDIGLIILDSIAALVSSRDYDSDMEKDNGMSGGIAKPLAKFIKKMLDPLSAKQNILILINQVRQVGTTFTGAAIYDEPGGHITLLLSLDLVREHLPTEIKSIAEMAKMLMDLDLHLQLLRIRLPQHKEVVDS